MAGHSIPLHEFPFGTKKVRIEKILPAPGPVNNSVHRHAYHELFLFSTGSGTHMIDLEQLTFQAPCIHMVSPGQVHKLDRSGDVSGFVLLFSPDLDQGILSDVRVRAMLRGGGSNSVAVELDEGCLKEALTIIGLIENEQDVEAATAAIVLENLLAILLLKCLNWASRSTKVTGPGTPDDLVTSFLEKVDEEYLEKRQVSAYAADLSISPGHLTELVRKRLGRSASEIVHERLLLEAKRLLLHADLSVKEVSFALKMEDPSYFTRMFRKATGLTPVEYREHIREKYQ